MFINATGFYVPEERVDNQHFLELNGLTSEWIEQRTGIRSRSKAKAEENINTMSMEAVRNALPKLPYDITDVDLIVSASYSPYDTVATAAHLAQHEFHIENAKALYLSSACSSFLNALEVVEGYFAMGKATKALILSADKNSAYYNETDPKAGTFGAMRLRPSSSRRNAFRKRIPRSWKYTHKDLVIWARLRMRYIFVRATGES